MARRIGHGLSERGRYWRGLLGAWQRSGLTQAAFCRQRGVKHVTFCWWKRRLAGRDGSIRPAAARLCRGGISTRTARTCAEPGARRPDGSAPAIFAPVHVRADEPSGVEGRIEIALAGGRRIRLRGRVDRQALADVLAVLEFDAVRESRAGDCSSREASAC